MSVDRRGFLSAALGVTVTSVQEIRSGAATEGPALFAIKTDIPLSADQMVRLRESIKPYAEKYNFEVIFLQPGWSIEKMVEKMLDRKP